MTTLQSLKDLPAPAKMNLFLHVTGRTPTGMHTLESLFILIDLADRLSIEVLNNGEIERTGDVIGDVSQDLCVRAARLLQNHTGCSLGARIHVEKKIPAGAGLGGGSSDAATTLMALNHLWRLNLSQETLMKLGLQLGADVPFFIFGQSAFATGVGEQLVPLAVPDATWALVMPNQPTPTGKIFSSPDLTRNTKSLTMSVLSDALQTQWPNLPGHNDLQAVAVRLNPEIESALIALGKNARMTGSGSAVFCWAADEESAKNLCNQRPASMQGWIVHTLHHHPLKI